MNVPNAEHAIIDIRKLRDYCLNASHEKGKHKALRFRNLFGMDASDADELREILLKQVKTAKVQPSRSDQYG